MGGFGYDRQVFVKSNKPASPGPPSRSPLPGALVLILVAVLGAVATYRYINAGGFAHTDPTASPHRDAKIKQLQHKIATLEAKIEELERKRSRPAAKSSSAEAPVPKTQPKHTPVLSAKLAQRPPVQSAPKAHPDQPEASPSTTSAISKSSVPAPKKPNPDLTALKGDLHASHQEWEATVNRLGNVVGQVDSQRNMVEQNQQAVNHLLQLSRRSGIPFNLKKESRFTRVGPISVKLSKTDVRNQRYTLRIIVDDKPVELKDRALNEVIQFYTSRSQYPMELVVSKIDRGQVEGMLGVPKGLNSEEQYSQALSK